MNSDRHSAEAPPESGTARPAGSSVRFAGALAVIAIPAAVIAFLALRPSPYLQYLWWMPRRLGVWADHHGVLRNAVAFFAFGFLVFVVLGEGWRQFAAVAVFAIALEVAQLGIRGRIFDWRDIVVSLAGIALAWPLSWIANRVRR